MSTGDFGKLTVSFATSSQFAAFEMGAAYMLFGTFKRQTKVLFGAVVLSASALACTAVCPSYAMSDTAANTQAVQSLETTVWIRAKLEYPSSDGVKDIGDDNIEMASSKWTKKGEYYYYADPVRSGESIDLMKSVWIPSDWDNSYANKNFSVIVTVEASEVLPTDTGWNENSEVSYSQTFDTSVKGAEQQNLQVTKGNITIGLKEYQVDSKTGKEEEYVNDKIITPGEKVSKIVRITVNGDKSLIQKQKKTITITNIWTGDYANASILIGTAVACGGVATLLFLQKKKG